MLILYPSPRGIPSSLCHFRHAAVGIEGAMQDPVELNNVSWCADFIMSEDVVQANLFACSLLTGG
jgi:hypothetical protein